MRLRLPGNVTLLLACALGARMEHLVVCRRRRDRLPSAQPGRPRELSRGLDGQAHRRRCQGIRPGDASCFQRPMESSRSISRAACDG